MHGLEDYITVTLASVTGDLLGTQWWRHLVNAYDVEAGMAVFAGKTV